MPEVGPPASPPNHQNLLNWVLSCHPKPLPRRSRQRRKTQQWGPRLDLPLPHLLPARNLLNVPHLQQPHHPLHPPSTLKLRSQTSSHSSDPSPANPYSMSDSFYYSSHHSETRRACSLFLASQSSFSSSAIFHSTRRESSRDRLDRFPHTARLPFLLSRPRGLVLGAGRWCAI